MIKTTKRTLKAIGLMSGTSLDGMDVALIETDGEGQVRSLGFETYPYQEAVRGRIRACLRAPAAGPDPYPTPEEKGELKRLEDDLTALHAQAVQAFLSARGLAPESVDLIGFHGQTVFHRPDVGLTIQIGDGAALARATGIDVVNDFRSQDVQAGGQGAPLVPLYHRALAFGLPQPVAIVNIGGVANVTLIWGEGDDEILAFDTGPGNALIDDWMLQKTGKPFDRDGACAAKGKVNDAILQAFLNDPYVTKGAPKSLDRAAFFAYAKSVEDLSVEDGAATLTRMSVEAIALALKMCPNPIRSLYITGGGRHNETMMRWISEQAEVTAQDVDTLGWSGDGLEAEAFAYLAVRSVKDLPLTLCGTTGAPAPQKGGVFHRH